MRPACLELVGRVTVRGPVGVAVRVEEPQRHRRALGGVEGGRGGGVEERRAGEGRRGEEGVCEEQPREAHGERGAVQRVELGHRGALAVLVLAGVIVYGGSAQLLRATSLSEMRGMLRRTAPPGDA